MKPRLLDYLVCPKDQSELRMVVWNFRPIHVSEHNRKIASQMGIAQEKISKEIFEGVLVNHQRKIIYPIIDGIPRLLVFASPAMRAFADKHRARLKAELPGYRLPDFHSGREEQQGAEAFQHQIFPGDFEISFRDKALMEALVKSLERLVDADKARLTYQSVLDIGLGLGGVAGRFAQDQQCELIGLDISHLVDSVQKTMVHYPFVNWVQGSVIAPPLKGSTFDLVYSYGGLNRLYSLKDALAQICTLPKKRGRLSVWFDEDSALSLPKMQKVLISAEKVMRPMIATLPRRVRAYAMMSCMPLYLMHQRLFPEHYAERGLLEGVKGAVVTAQKRLEMQLSKELNDNEVLRLFERYGYVATRRLSERSHPLLFGLSLWNCAGVEGTRT